MNFQGQQSALKIVFIWWDALEIEQTIVCTSLKFCNLTNYSKIYQKKNIFVWRKQLHRKSVIKLNFDSTFMCLYAEMTTLIYKHRLQWVCVQYWHQTHTIWNMFDSEA